MAKAFSVILSDLRKERHLSQKEAAQKLEISQSLLSHYEKGIRECSLEFLIRAADFYGVSCDYLLGRTEEKEYSKTVSPGLNSGDNELSPATMLKACAEIKNMLDQNANPVLNLVFANEIYRFILLAINSGCLPSEWSFIGSKPFSKAHLDCIALYSDELSSSINCVSQASETRITPTSIETVGRAVNDYLKNKSAEMLPFIK